MNYGSIKVADCANGPGMRTSLFVSGCRRHCKGCFNAETWDFDYGEAFTKDVEDYVISTLDNDYIEGLSILGGDPFEPENQRAVFQLLFRFWRAYPKKNAWIYTGFTFEELMEKADEMESKGGMLHQICGCARSNTILVDGPFIEAQKDISLRYRGSRNQRMLMLKQSWIRQEPVIAEEWMCEK